ncbi:MAG: zinc ribbon domain-containing protein [Chloroflexi bacterium]|nr:zinc ribbon domain-containing protein [Chloroflexota bacterium]
MFCPNCGMQLPDNARFCSKCGNQVSVTQSRVPEPKTSEQGINDSFNQLTDEQKKEVVESLFDTSLEKAVATYVELAKNGKVWVADLNTGIYYLEQVKNLPDIDSDKNRLYLALLVYQDGKDVYDAHFKRWLDADVDPDLLLGDFAQFLNGGLQELMLHTALFDNAVQNRIMAHMGIVRFLEQVLLTTILLSLKLAHREISPEGKAMLIQQHGEELVKVAFERFEAWYNELLTKIKSENS